MLLRESFHVDVRSHRIKRRNVFFLSNILICYIKITGELEKLTVFEISYLAQHTQIK